MHVIWFLSALHLFGVKVSVFCALQQKKSEDVQAWDCQLGFPIGKQKAALPQSNPAQPSSVPNSGWDYSPLNALYALNAP